MTTRNSFRKRPPFPFVNRARANNLPCNPKISWRGTKPYYFPELMLFQGPQQIAVPGDNSYETLFGVTWALLFCDDNHLYVLQRNGAGWDVVADNLPTFPTFDGTERAFTAAFDQSARLIYAYEKDGVIKVTRWDSEAGQYVQNVNVTGVDPCLLNDAAVRFEVPDSDVVLFYLSSDRTGVHYRVQREIYGTEHALTFDVEAPDPVEYAAGLVMDYAVALPYRFELLVSEREGSKREFALISDYYPIPVQDHLNVNAAPGLASYRQPMWKQLDEDRLDVTAAPSVGRYTLSTLERDEQEALNIEALPRTGAYTLTTFVRDEQEALNIEAVPGLASYIPTTAKQLDSDALDINAAPGKGYYRATG